MMPTVTVLGSGWKDRDLEIDLRVVQFDGSLFASTRKSNEDIRPIDISGLTIVELRDNITSLGEPGRGYWFPRNEVVLDQLIEALTKIPDANIDKIIGRFTKAPGLSSDVQITVRKIKQMGLEYVEVRDYIKSLGIFGKGYWFPVITLDVVIEGLRVIQEGDAVPAEMRRLVAKRAKIVVDDEEHHVRCAGCRQAVAITSASNSQRLSAFCCALCLYEHTEQGNDATTEIERNAQWEQLITVGGVTPLQTSRMWGVAHSLVYRTMDRIRQEHPNGV